MLFVNDIIKKVRYNLNDTEPDNQRWTDERLIALVKDALRDLSLKTNLFTTSDFFLINKKNNYYNLPDYVEKIHRIEHLSVPLELITYENMEDTVGYGWEYHTGTRYSHAVFNLQTPSSFVLYPKINDNSFISSTSTSDTDYGVITDLSLLEDKEIVLEEGFGTPSDIDLSKYLKVYYNALIYDFDKIDDKLSPLIKSNSISAIVFYVTSFAFADSVDAQNRSKQQDFLMLYTDIVQPLGKERASSSVTYKYKQAEKDFYYDG